MRQPNLSLKQQIGVCQHVCRLVKAKLPIPGELQKLATESGGIIAPPAQSASKIVGDQLESGKSLIDALTNDDVYHSRSLAACIEAGENTKQLDRTLQSWTNLHIRNATNKQSFRNAMLYPLTLVCLACTVLALLIWKLIPDYQKTYYLFEQEMPVWLQWLAAVRENFVWVMLAIFIGITLPTFVFLLRKRGTDALGLPTDPIARDRQHALGCEIAALMLEHRATLTDVCRLSSQATGVNRRVTDGAFEQISKQQKIEGISGDASALLASIYIDAIQPKDAQLAFQDLASNLRSRADDAALRKTRWLPMLVALSVGGVTLITYAFLIYLPWILLMQKIGSPENLNMDF